MSRKLLRIEERTVAFRGAGRAAEALGVSRPHLSLVLHGKRKASARLAARLRRMGLEVAEGAAARPVGIAETRGAGRKAMAAEEGGAE